MSDDTADMVSKAMRRAWQLGQTYWQQADSESYSANKRAATTEAKFSTLVVETLAAIAQPPAPTAQPMFYVRLCSDGTYEGPIHADAIERVRVESGAWSPLYLAAQPVQQPTAEPASPHIRAMANAVLRQLGEPFPREEVDLDAVGLLCRVIAGGYVEGSQAAPAERQPLSDEQIDAIWKAHVLPGFGDRQKFYSPILYARAIEAAHGIATANGEKL